MNIDDLSFDLDENFKNKFNNIKKYNKQTLIELLIKLNNKYKLGLEKDLVVNVNKFFSLKGIKDKKELLSKITFQHIFISTYTRCFGILTTKNNIKSFKEIEEIESFIKKDLSTLGNFCRVLAESLFIQKQFVIYLGEGYILDIYTLICFHILIHLFNFQSRVLFTEYFLKFSLGEGNNLKLIFLNKLPFINNDVFKILYNEKFNLLNSVNKSGNKKFKIDKESSCYKISKKVIFDKTKPSVSWFGDLTYEDDCWKFYCSTKYLDSRYNEVETMYKKKIILKILMLEIITRDTDLEKEVFKDYNLDKDFRNVISNLNIDFKKYININKHLIENTGYDIICLKDLIFNNF